MINNTPEWAEGYQPAVSATEGHGWSGSLNDPDYTLSGGPRVPVQAAVEAVDPALLRAGGVLVGAFHGYRRAHTKDEQLGSAAFWGIAGALAPVITIAVALSQGIARKAPRKAS
jgi:hypothetical protein